MNRENIEYMIGVMESAENLDMDYFQNTGIMNPSSETIKDLHQCGNTACFAGYMAISDKFKQDGGRPSAGAPEINNLYEEQAVAYWLDISEDLACDIVYPYGGPLFNGKCSDDIKPRDVIRVLQNILDGEYGEQSFDGEVHD